MEPTATMQLVYVPDESSQMVSAVLKNLSELSRTSDAMSCVSIYDASAVVILVNARREVWCFEGTERIKALYEWLFHRPEGSISLAGEGQPCWGIVDYFDALFRNFCISKVEQPGDGSTAVLSRSKSSSCGTYRCSSSGVDALFDFVALGNDCNQIRSHIVWGSWENERSVPIWCSSTRQRFEDDEEGDDAKGPAPTAIKALFDVEDYTGFFEATYKSNVEIVVHGPESPIARYNGLDGARLFVDTLSRVLHGSTGVMKISAREGGYPSTTMAALSWKSTSLNMSTTEVFVLDETHKIIHQLVLIVHSSQSEAEEEAKEREEECANSLAENHLLLKLQESGLEVEKLTTKLKWVKRSLKISKAADALLVSSKKHRGYGISIPIGSIAYVQIGGEKIDDEFSDLHEPEKSMNNAMHSVYISAGNLSMRFRFLDEQVATEFKSIYEECQLQLRLRRALPAM